MTWCKTIYLYGSPSSRKNAKLALENQPQIKRIDVSSNYARLRLLISSPLSEGDFITLLQASGISGFYISC